MAGNYSGRRWPEGTGTRYTSSKRRYKMLNLVQEPMLAFLPWYNWAIIIALIAVIIVLLQIRKRQV